MERKHKDRKWWWIAGAGAVLLLALLANSPRQPRGVQPNPISNRQMPSPSVPRSTPIRGGDVRTPGNTMPGPGVTDTQASLNTRVENAANSVDGVNAASAVVVSPPNTGQRMKDTVALVGVSLAKSIQGDAKKSTISEVEDAVREVPGIDKVAVTAEPELFSRIKRVSRDIADGRLPSVFANDMKAISDKLMSKAK